MNQCRLVACVALGWLVGLCPGLVQASVSDTDYNVTIVSLFGSQSDEASFDGDGAFSIASAPNVAGSWSEEVVLVVETPDGTIETVRVTAQLRYLAINENVLISADLSAVDVGGELTGTLALNFFGLKIPYALVTGAVIEE